MTRNARLNAAQQTSTHSPRSLGYCSPDADSSGYSYGIGVSARTPKCPKEAVMSSFDVRFEEKTMGDSVLEIVSPARKSTLENVRSVLFDLRIQIVRVESSVRE